MTNFSDITIRLVEEANNVEKESFPGATNIVAMGDALSFLLGVPREDVPALLDDVAMSVERRVPHHHGKLNPLAAMYYETMRTAICLGIASERIAKIDV